MRKYIPLMLSLALLLSAMAGHAEGTDAMAEAITLLETGAYQRASVLFAAMADEPDAARYLAYCEALGCLDSGDLLRAREVLTPLSLLGFYDSAQAAAYVDGRLWELYGDHGRAATAYEKANWHDSAQRLEALAAQPTAEPPAPLPTPPIAVRDAQEGATLLAVGIDLYELRLLDGALEALTDAIDADPAMPEAYYVRGLTLYAMERFEEAIADHERALALDAAFTQARISRAATLVRVGRVSEAIAAFDELIAADAVSWLLYQNRAMAYAMQGRFDEALADLDAALALDAQNVDLLLAKGGVLGASGRFEEAVAAYDAALDMEPGNPDAYAMRESALSALDGAARGGDSM